MTRNLLEPDYLVIGSGAMGMAFTDTLITETSARVVMVDRHHQPGGHWNDAYPFVRLHQPSSCYGVNSKKLGSDAIDATGWNEGLYELATNSEVCAYFDQVMQQQFLASGRVDYFPMCEYKGDGRFVSLVSGVEYNVVAKRVVDATYMNVTVPSTKSPSYEVSGNVVCAPPNVLARITHREWDRYTIIGAGKTGMDACLFLLKSGVDPECISWVMPRDSWLLNRARWQGEKKWSESIYRSTGEMFAAVASLSSVEDVFVHLNECGQLLRLDEQMRPTMYRCATVTQAELEQLRRIKDVVRLGRVKSIESTTIVFDAGTREIAPNTLHVDCTADGLERRPRKPVFVEDAITLQSVRTCQPVFSAAFIGHVEANYDDEIIRNEICAPIPHPDTDIDLLRCLFADLLNAGRWAQDETLQAWLAHARLDGFSPPDSTQVVDPKYDEVTAANAAVAFEKLQGFLGEIGS